MASTSVSTTGPPARPARCRPNTTCPITAPASSDPASTATFDITLPTPFNAAGRHFIAVQPVSDENVWWPISANYPTVRGAVWHKRNNLTGGPWTPLGSFSALDMAFDLYGTLLSVPRIDGFETPTVERSGLLHIKGAFFGTTKAPERLKIDGKPSQFIPYWSDNLIIAHVPENATIGNVAVEVTSPAGTGSGTVGVTTRQSQGRIRWRAQAAGDYVSFRPAVAPPGVPGAGTVYAATNAGYLYAWANDGALKWVAPGADGGSAPVSVGLDGTIYAATTVSDPNTGKVGPGIAAFNPNGTLKWSFGDPTGQSVRAGPDGKIYFIFRPTTTTGINFGALRPDGTLAWNVNRNFYTYGQSGKELTFGKLLPNIYFTFNSNSDPDPTLNGGLFAYNFDGQLVWQKGGLCCGVPTTAPDEDLRYGDARYSALNGSTVYDFNFPPFGSQSPDGIAEAGPDNVHYVKGWGRLWAINPNGTEKWHFDPLDPDGSYVSLGAPVVNPINTTILMGGGGAFGQESLFMAVDPATGQEQWRQIIPRTPGYDPYGNVFLGERAVFTPDGNTGYLAGDLNGDQNGVFQQKYLYFYSLDTSANSVPINERPVVTITSPLDGANYPKVSTINLAATATDDQPVSGVEFYMQRGFTTPRQLITTDTTAPYTATFNANDDGGYAFIAVVRDAGGLVAESRVTILTINEPPRINWLHPASGANFPVGTTIKLEVNAFDPDGTVSKVEFYNSQIGLVGEDATPDANGNFSIDLTNAAAGTYNYTAWANDNDGIRISAANSFTVGATPTPTPIPTPVPTPTPVPGAPTVAITSPASGSSFAPGTNVTVTAEASDSDGTIARVDFFRQFGSGSPLCTDFNPPYTCQVTSGNPDIFNIYAEARDNAGNTTRSQTVQIVFHDPAGQYTISGRLCHISSQPGNEIFLPYALVKLSLGQSSSTYREMRTDAQGNFSFDHLSRGGDYTVTPSEPGYQFYPPSVAWMGIVENEFQEFIADGPRPPGPSPTPAPGSNVLAWEKFYDSPYNLADYNSHVAIDAQGNTYVTGASVVPGDRGDTDISTVKYSPSGEQLWAKTFVGPGNYKDWPTDIEVDAQGNVYVAGTSWRGSAFSYDLVTIKYDTNGTQQWVNHLNGPLGQSDFGNALAIDASGNAVVTGYVRSRNPFTGKNYDEFATVKYAPDGAEQWVSRRTEAEVSDHPIDVVTDSAGNIYVTGFAYATTNGVQSKDLVTVKYSPAGQELWATRHNGRPGGPGPIPLNSNPISDEPGGIGLDPSGNVYVFGSNEPGTAEDDFLLLKYNPTTGALVWGRNWSGPAYDYARDMAIDASGNIYLTGETYDKVFQTINDEPSSDAATVKFDPAGNLVWERVYRAFPGKWDGGRHIELDASGNAYVGAYSEGFFNSDTAVIKYQPDGTEAWVYRYDNPNNASDQLGDMASDADGNLYLTGHANITVSGNTSADFVTFKLAASTVTLNSPPEVTLIIGPTIAGNPTGSGDELPPTGPTIAGRSIRLSSEAFDRDGSVVRVQYFDSGVLIGSDTTSPYGIDWENPSEGTHAINAMATDNAGATRTTPTQAVTVEAEPQTFAISGQLTFNGSPFAGAQVSLSGTQTGSFTTGADGRYTFAGLVAGATTPSRPPARATRSRLQTAPLLR